MPLFVQLFKLISVTKQMPLNWTQQQRKRIKIHTSVFIVSHKDNPPGQFNNMTCSRNDLHPHSFLFMVGPTKYRKERITVKPSNSATKSSFPTYYISCRIIMFGCARVPRQFIKLSLTGSTCTWGDLFQIIFRWKRRRCWVNFNLRQRLSSIS